MLIMLAVALLTACSAIKLAYNQAPDLTYWWIDGYLDLNEQQTPRVREELARLFAWHRSSELPKTASLLQKAQTQLLGNVSPAAVCSVYDDVRGLYEAVLDRALPPAADIAVTVTPEQLVHLQRKYTKNNEEYARDYLQGSDSERASKRLKSAVQRSEMIYGKLEEAQITAIKAAIQKSGFNAALGMKERERRQKEALEMLAQLGKTRATPQAALAALRSYAQRSTSSPDPAYRAYAEQMTREACESFATVHASTTPEQRAKAVQTFKAYESDLRVLAGQK